MKTCAICSLDNEESVPTCTACGEASWMLARVEYAITGGAVLERPPVDGPTAHDGDEPVPETMPEVVPETVEEAKPARKGRR